MRRIPCCFLAVALCFFTACESKDDGQKKAIESAVRENAAAMQAEDLEAVMATIYPQGVVYAGTRPMVQSLFEAYDLDYKLETVEVIKFEGDTAEVKFIQTTVSRDGNNAKFRNNRVEGHHTLRNDAGKWKISATTPHKIEYLDDSKP